MFYTEIYEMLIPLINFKDIKNILLPVDYFFDSFNLDSTCFKINCEYVNIKIVKFERNKIFTLDKWFNEIRNFLNNPNTLFPTPMFENQKLTDLVCILLCIIDKYFINRKQLNICFRNNLYQNYKSHLNSFQKAELIQFLKLTNFSNEEFNSELNLDIEIYHLNELSSPFDKSYFFPIQNVNSIKKYLSKKTSLYKSDFLKNSSNFYEIGNRNLKCFNYYRQPDFVFGLSDAKTCELYIMKYNSVNFFYANKNSFIEWLNKGISLHFNKRKEFQISFPIYQNLGAQDTLLLIESWLYSKSSYKLCLKKYNNLSEINLELTFGNRLDWPFNNIVFTYYYLTYLFVFYFLTKSRKKNKVFSNSWTNFLYYKAIHLFSFDSALINSFNFPSRFKIKTIPQNSLDFQSLTSKG